MWLGLVLKVKQRALVVSDHGGAGHTGWEGRGEEGGVRCEAAVSTAPLRRMRAGRQEGGREGKVERWKGKSGG